MWWPQHYWKLFYILLYILFCRWELGTWLKSTYGVGLVTVIALVSGTLVSVKNVVTHSLDMTRASQGRSQILLPIWAQSWNLLRMRSQIGLSSRVTNWLLSYCILLRFDLFLFPWNVLRTYVFFFFLIICCMGMHQILCVSYFISNCSYQAKLSIHEYRVPLTFPNLILQAWCDN